MTKRHFESLAAVFRTAAEIYRRGDSAEYRRGCNDTTALLAERIADVCAAENPRFDRDRFLAACGIEQEVSFFD